MAEAIAIVIAYLLGSLQTSLLLSKWLKFPDPRLEGSGSSGATNTLRTMGKDKALITLIGDVLKGFLAVLIGYILGLHGFFLAFTAFAAVLGHVFPCFFQFRGGKGVATALGGLLLLSFWTALVVIIVWLVVVFTMRYVSLASLIATVTAPILILVFSHAAYFLPLLMIAGLIIWKHKENIQRLRAGTEDKAKLN